MWASKAEEGSRWRLKLSQVLTEVGLLKRKEIFGAEYISRVCVCVCIYNVAIFILKQRRQELNYTLGDDS